MISPSIPLAVITGAAGGTGSALCELLLSQGWAILGIDHNANRLRDLSKRFEDSPFIPLAANIQDGDLIDKLDNILSTPLQVKALINIAAQSIGNTIDHLTDEDWDASFQINVTPAMKLSRYLAPHLRRNAGGVIVNVGSPVGIVGTRKPSYAASKAALTGLTMSLARNLGPDNIRVNLLLPGPMITPLTEDWPEEKRQAIANTSFLKRLCTPSETANIIAFLISEHASYLTGSVIDATAGSMFGH